ncbi:DnaJ-domain-containing protein [Hypoxylon sp. NC1633]|nr:DnaJ-domain-containing protein [Hypoxylon sp. NC1633]
MVRPSFPQHDLYKVLGVDSKASLDAIKKAYRDLCLKVHPDKARGGNTAENNAKFGQVQEAWEILKDNILRKEYDNYRANSTQYNNDRAKDAGSGRRPREPSKEWGGRGYKERSGKDGKSHQSEHRKPGPSGRDGTNNRHQSSGPGGHSYGAKPNAGGKPYYERWEGSRGPSGRGEGYRPPPDTQRPPHRDDTSYSGYPYPRSTMADKIVAMRLRIDLSRISQELDAVDEDMTETAQAFLEDWADLSESEWLHWCKLWKDARDAFDYAENLYNKINSDLWAVETGHQLPAHVNKLAADFGALQTHITRMKYNAIGAGVIVGEMLMTAFYRDMEPVPGFASYEYQRQQFLSLLEEKLKIMATY